MKRSTVFVVGALLAVFAGWVMIASNRLPAELVRQIEDGRRRVADARKTVENERGQVAASAAEDPVLFRVRGFDQEWPGRFAEASGALNDAERIAQQLEALRQKNRKSSRGAVEQLLGQERERTTAALTEAASTLREAQKRSDLKKNLPGTLARLDGAAKSLAAADYSSLIPRVQKAEQDWPSKKAELQSRLDALEQAKKDATGWDQAVHLLQAKPAAQVGSDDYAKALDLEESVDHAPGPVQAGELGRLSQQLYTSWDDVLEDLDKGGGRYRERVKHVVTTVAAPAEKGATRSEELWRDVPETQWHAVEDNLGMAIAHKPLGRFDSEADQTPQPPGYAYIASPAEGRNQYGYWENRDGGSFWHWLPEYLILSQILGNNRTYTPIPSYEWNHYYEAQRYGRTYYGRDESGAPVFGSHGTFTQQHYGNSRYVQSGGFGSSKYASGQRAAAPTASSSGRTFGSSPSSPSGAGRKFGGSSSSGRSFGSGSRSAGRSFGGRRR